MNLQLVSICVKFIGFCRKTASRQPPRFNESQTASDFHLQRRGRELAGAPACTHTHTRRKQAPFGVYVNVQKQNG